MNTHAHGGLTERSRSYPVVTHDRKGREGNWRGIGGEGRSWSPLHHGVGLGDVAFRLGMMVIDKFYADGWTEVTVREDLGPCWEYNGTRSPHCYGVTRQVASHRLALMLVGVEIPEGHHVLHMCDNPPCVNPAHLRAGTRSENMRDMVSKGRHHYPNGDDHHRTVLTDEQVRELRDNYTGERGEMSRLAEQYGITGNQVSLILRGLRRKEAPGRIHPKRWRAGGWPT